MLTRFIRFKLINKSGNRYYLDGRIARETQVPEAGSVLPPLGGDTVSLAESGKCYSGFRAFWKMLCRAESVHVKEIYQKLREKGLDGLSVPSDKDGHGGK
ncbi:MAG: hypothetical protein ACLU4N_12865 [Butyricimonas faecihominis]